MYLAVTNFHTQILPTTLLLSFAAAREGVPFPSIVEVILMELSFELLREAGVRLPGAMGNTIGIVGGLIIGQAAVEANLVSPIVVIVVAFTALCSFAIPNEEFATAFRILKFFFIIFCAWIGFYGFLLCLLTVLIHLSHLKSFGIPYLMPIVGADLNDYKDERDCVGRLPLIYLNRRPIFARRTERIKFLPFSSSSVKIISRSPLSSTNIPELTAFLQKKIFAAKFSEQARTVSRGGTILRSLSLQEKNLFL